MLNYFHQYLKTMSDPKRSCSKSNVENKEAICKEIKVIVKNTFKQKTREHQFLFLISNFLETLLNHWNVTKLNFQQEPFLCKVCCKVLQMPTTFSCGHSVCQKCSSKVSICPTCSTEIVHQFPARSNMLLSLVLKKLFPSNYTNCSQTVEIGNLQETNNNSSNTFNNNVPLANANSENVSRLELCKTLQEQLHDSSIMEKFSKDDFNTVCENLMGSKEYKLEQFSVSNPILEVLLILILNAYIQFRSIELKEENTLLQICQELNNDLNGDFLINCLSDIFISVLNCGKTRFEQNKTNIVKDYMQQNTNVNIVKTSDFECCLCMQLVYHPFCTPCGHVFCLNCIQRSLDHSPLCPLCKQFVTHKSNDLKAVDDTTQQLLVSIFSSEYNIRKVVYDTEVSNIRSHFPVFVCTLALPSVSCPLHIFEPRYRVMLRRCVNYFNSEFAMCLSSQENQFHDFGTILYVKNIKYLDNGCALIDTIGTKRFKTISQGEFDGYGTCTYSTIVDTEITDENEIEYVKKLAQMVYNKANEWLNHLPADTLKKVEMHYGFIPEDVETINGENGPNWHWWLLNILPVENETKVKILEKHMYKLRLLALNHFLDLLKKSMS